ncbi:prepilin peptidase [Persicirhabdus sediminis]|uniref:Prepilin peptidase n=1 Tax=Persicirhabdus sediminis TaxID=454144 RepID=A0A8J7SHX9_9BACT|nr:A24 family peptidase [Persicirhabdus sediminis]MBK1791085.1 prepilin peptidase [Persicirhabdus sediminis]
MSETLTFMTQYIHQHYAFFTVAAFMFGASIGSFLNVAIYRLPRGLSVNEPKRSFCPTCKKQIPMFRNIPLFTWLIQRGRCAECHCRIPVRYFLVEFLMAVIFALIWWFAPSIGLAFYFMILAALLMVVICVDIELMLIPLQVTWLGTAVGLVGSYFLAMSPDNIFRADSPWDGVKLSAIGFVAGFAGLWAVVVLGKLVFGRQVVKFDKAVDWELREPVEGEDDEMAELSFVLDGEPNAWSDLFYRKTDRLIIEGYHFFVDGVERNAEKLVIFGDRIELDGDPVMIEDLVSLEGKAKKVVIPREAMGMGDVYLLGMLGACFGPQSLIFIVFAACVYSIILAIIGRLGIGSRMPFGPSLAFGAVTWAICGWQLWDWYFSLMVMPSY